MKNRFFVVLFIIMSLAGGVFIYAITRSEAIYLNQWLAQLGNGKVLYFFQALFQNTPFPNWIIYSLPDALWMAALTMFILLIWDFRLHKKSLPWIALAIICGISFEVLQGFEMIKGTFDVMDLSLMLLAAFLPILFTMLKFKSCKIN